jgi:hypothetical protein
MLSQDDHLFMNITTTSKAPPYLGLISSVRVGSNEGVVNVSHCRETSINGPSGSLAGCAGGGSVY